MKQKSLQEIIAAFDPSHTDSTATVYVALEGNPYAIGEITGGQNAISSKVASKWQVAARLFGSSAGVGVAGGAGAVSRMAFAIITAHQEHLCFYILNKWGMSMAVERKVILPHNDIIKIKGSKFLIWNNLKMRFSSGGKTHTLLVKMCGKVATIGNQEQNIVDFMAHLDKVTHLEWK